MNELLYEASTNPEAWAGIAAIIVAWLEWRATRIKSSDCHSTKIALLEHRVERLENK